MEGGDQKSPILRRHSLWTALNPVPGNFNEHQHGSETRPASGHCGSGIKKLLSNS